VKSTDTAFRHVATPPRPRPDAHPRAGGAGGSSIHGVSIWLVVGVLLVVGCVLVVALPFLRRPGISAAEDRLGEPDALERRRLELSEERDRALAALKELEFDHRTGKVSDEDYRALVGPLRRRAAETLRALEPAAKPRVRETDDASSHARR
jgi:hypothetical protein